MRFGDRPQGDMAATAKIPFQHCVVLINDDDHWLAGFWRCRGLADDEVTFEDLLIGQGVIDDPEGKRGIGPVKKQLQDFDLLWGRELNNWLPCF